MFAAPKTREEYLDEAIEKLESAEEKHSLSPELETIKQRAIANGTFMKAPNDKPSKLNERQWLQVRTNAFKKWFGDWENDPQNASKVIDENGEPLVVYHGGAVFNKFSKAKSSQGVFWFSEDKNYSDQYTQNLKKRGLNGETKNLFINLRNPANWDEYDKLTTEQLKNSKDGAFLEDGEEKLGFVFSPSQIKSATDNTGAFDSGNDDIRFSLGTPVEETRNLVALHNLHESVLAGMLKLEGLPMPSIAIVKSAQGHNNFGSISFVFDKKTIDPKRKANKVYTGDAWTVTFPRIEYKINEKAFDKIKEIYRELKKKFPKESTRLDCFYFAAVDGGRREVPTRRFINKLKDDILVKSAFVMHTKGFSFYEGVGNFDREGWEEATNKLNEFVNQTQAEYEKWLKGLFDGVIEKKGIRNNKERFTPTGKERSWEQLHDAINTKNIFKVMKGKSPRNRGRLQLNDFELPIKSLKEIKDKSEKFLGTIPENEHFWKVQKILRIKNEALFDMFNRVGGREKWGDISKFETYLSKIVQEYGYDRYALEIAILEDLRKRGILGERERAEVGLFSRGVDNLWDAIEAYRNLQKEYFEAKPERLVGFDEVKAAIVPDTLNAELKAKLREKGVQQVIEYEAGNNADRLAKLNAPELNDIRFSLINGRYSNGKRWSRRADDAFEEGYLTSGQIADKYGVSIGAVEHILTDVLGFDEWHHVGARAKEIYFYNPKEFGELEIAAIKAYVNPLKNKKGNYKTFNNVEETLKTELKKYENTGHEEDEKISELIENDEKIKKLKEEVKELEENVRDEDSAQAFNRDKKNLAESKAELIVRGNIKEYEEKFKSEGNGLEFKAFLKKERRKIAEEIFSKTKREYVKVDRNELGLKKKELENLIDETIKKSKEGIARSERSKNQLEKSLLEILEAGKKDLEERNLFLEEHKDDGYKEYKGRRIYNVGGERFSLSRDEAIGLFAGTMNAMGELSRGNDGIVMRGTQKVEYPFGRLGVKGMGFLHIVDQRVHKDGETLENAIDIAIKVAEAVAFGKETNSPQNTHHFDLGGVRAIVADKADKSLVITGYEINADNFKVHNLPPQNLQSVPSGRSEEIVAALKNRLAQIEAVRKENDDEVRYSLIGEVAAQRMQNNEVELANLTVAKEMYEKLIGKKPFNAEGENFLKRWDAHRKRENDAKTLIKIATGWELDKRDGKWKYEMPLEEIVDVEKFNKIATSHNNATKLKVLESWGDYWKSKVIGEGGPIGLRDISAAERFGLITKQEQESLEHTIKKAIDVYKKGRDIDDAKTDEEEAAIRAEHKANLKESDELYEEARAKFVELFNKSYKSTVESLSQSGKVKTWFYLGDILKPRFDEIAKTGEEIKINNDGKKMIAIQDIKEVPVLLSKPLKTKGGHFQTKFSTGEQEIKIAIYDDAETNLNTLEHELQHLFQSRFGFTNNIGAYPHKYSEISSAKANSGTYNKHEIEAYRTGARRAWDAETRRMIVFDNTELYRDNPQVLERVKRLKKHWDALQKAAKDVPAEQQTAQTQAIANAKITDNGVEIEERSIVNAAGELNLDFGDELSLRYSLSPMNVAEAYSQKSEIAQAVEEIESVRERVENDGIKYSLIAYHGGIFDFDKPQREFRGKGEGNAAHGAGFYAAMNRDVSKVYAENLFNRAKMGFQSYDLVFKMTQEALGLVDEETYAIAKILDNPYLEENEAYKVVVFKLNEQIAEDKECLKEIRDGTSEYFSEEDVPALEDDLLAHENALDFVKKNKSIFEKFANTVPAKIEEARKDFEKASNLGRFLHQLELPDDNGFNYLQEDEKITREQAQAISAALKVDEAEFLNLTGSSAYAMAGDILARTNKEKSISEKKTDASDLLRRAGIVGIRYNGSTDGECAVMFDENDVKVVDVERWSLARERVEKIKNSPTIEIRGDEIKLGNNEKENVKAAREYGKKIRGDYKNEDTGNVINLSMGGISEILHHSGKDIAALKSICAIPQIIKKSVYIGSKPNENRQNHPEIVDFEYYLCGLRIDGEDYTVKSVVSKSTTGKRYYDHKLTQIEKGDLISMTSKLSSMEIENSSPVYKVKDKRLVSILQELNDDSVRFSLADERKNARLAMYEQIEAHNKFYEDKANFELVGEKAKSVAWWMLKYGKDKLTNGAREEVLKGVPADEFIAHDIERLGKLIATVAREMLGENAKNATREDIVAACTEINKVRLYKRFGQIVAFDDADLVMQTHNALKTREETDDLNIVPEKIEESEFEKLELDKRIDALALKRDASNYEKAKRLERDRAFASKLTEKANEETAEDNEGKLQASRRSTGKNTFPRSDFTGTCF